MLTTSDEHPDEGKVGQPGVGRAGAEASSAVALKIAPVQGVISLCGSHEALYLNCRTMLVCGGNFHLLPTVVNPLGSGTCLILVVDHRPDF